MLPSLSSKMHTSAPAAPALLKHDDFLRLQETCVLLPNALNVLCSCQMPLMYCADTEGSFMVERVVEIADACIRHLKKLAINNGTAAQKEAVSTLSNFA